MRHKNEVEFEGIVELAEAIDQIESVLAGLRSGSIGLSHGDQSLNLKPDSTVKLEVEGRQKEHKESVSIKLKWRRQPQQVEAEPLVISQGAAETSEG